MADRYRFVQAAAPYAFLVVDNRSGEQVEGSVFRDSGGGGFAYQRGRWDGTKQVFDHRYAMSLAELSPMIEEYLEPKS